MEYALEVFGLAKRFTVGVGSCLATAEVLRDINVAVGAGEVVAIVGSPGAGKSTLLLCLAGLLSPERGEVRWFGDPSRASALKRVLLHVSRHDLMRTGGAGAPAIHLIDATRVLDCPELDRWLALRRDEGQTVIVASRDELRVRPLAARVLRLHRGVLHEYGPRPLVRVAEHAPH